MDAYIRRRLLLLLPVLLGITFCTFLLMQLPADDPVDMMYRASGAVSEAVKAQTRAELGLNQPLLLRYWEWLCGIVTGDLGHSYLSGLPVATLLLSKLPNTLLLTALSLALTIIAAVPLGILAALKQGRGCDLLIRTLTFLGNSLPGFFVALLLIYLFSLKLGWLPVLSNGGLQSFLLPSLTLALPMTAKYIRHIRSSILEELHKDYMAGALVRGIPQKVVLRQFILPASGVTLLTLFSLSIGSLLGGTAIVETIFMVDGIGKMAVDAILMRDYPLIQAYVIWTTLIFTCVNLCCDLLYHYLDPQVRLLDKGGDF
ncbi:ABC transporter permease subunit [uncultured Phascolarctobacterium sp.]|uniref:ABC transporter permease n=1 Tax=uncultured Phascolarctobacterium sp. TaxID=512296 RepID=UPI0027D95E33|nr:ABC transporter permease subunit [uncultured Phascolarctobacterium sp.]